ncbi:MAG: GDSL-type esterase/lipase family protein, partial [Planctomycetota bacterium]
MHRPWKRVSTTLSLLVVVLLFVLNPASHVWGQSRSQPSPFALNDGDRVVFVGDALVEQAQYSGWLEVLLSTRFADKNITFRNIGWSGDTPSGASRFGLSLLQAGREPADEGWKQLQKQIEQTKPDVLILGYGMASALEGGRSGMDEFAAELKQLCDFATKSNPDIRLVFLSPLRTLEPTPSKQALISGYAEVIRDIADERNAPFVSLTKVCLAPNRRKDPIHLNDAGYRELANAIGEQLSIGALPAPSPQLEQLRETILRKNEWWFHRSRPANMAYVFGFRKREQGQNAVEIPQFDALIETEEKRIAELRRLDAGSVVKPKEPRLESKFAEFQAQPRPEFSVADGWEISLWAENPLLNKPIQRRPCGSKFIWIGLFRSGFSAHRLISQPSATE